MSRPIIRTAYSILRKGEMVKVENRLAQAPYKDPMTWPQLKIFATVVAQVDESGKEFGRYKTDVHSLMQYAGLGKYSSQARKNAVEAIQSLINTSFIVPPEHSQGQDQGRMLFIPPFERVAYDVQTGEIFLDLNHNLRPYLTQLKSYFTLTPLAELVSLPSFYSGRLFVLVSSVRGFAAKEKRTFTLDWLVRYLSMPSGMRIDNLKTRLSFCRAAIRRNTSLTFDLVYMKEGQRVTAVRFDNIQQKRKLT